MVPLGEASRTTSRSTGRPSTSTNTCLINRTPCRNSSWLREAGDVVHGNSSGSQPVSWTTPVGGGPHAGEVSETAETDLPTVDPRGAEMALPSRRPVPAGMSFPHVDELATGLLLAGVAAGAVVHPTRATA